MQFREYITAFCGEFEYPAEATEVLSATYNSICQNEDAIIMFNENIELFQKNEFTQKKQELILLDKISELVGVHQYTVHLLYFICLSYHTKALYEQRNIPYKVYYDSMSDLKWKLFECHKLYGIWGSFVAWWFKDFFNLSRFALGRLQYELIPFEYDYPKGGLSKGDLVLNIHIPSCGRLTKEDCVDSYKKAAEFYKDSFVGRNPAFVCSSWLLFPRHREFLPAKSNILAFMDFFDIIDSHESDDYEVLWRIFNKKYEGSVSDLPQETSLQRAYIDWVSKGNKIGEGVGVFIYIANLA